MLKVLQQHQSEFACALVHHQSTHEQFFRKITKTSKISPQLALDIYRNNTHGARLKSLEITYPVCRKILGNETFHLIAQQYVIEGTEGSSDLNHFGESFNLHIRSLLAAGRLAEEYCYLTDLIAFEYKMHDAYYADTDPIFPFKQFEQKVDNGQSIYFKTSSALALIVSEYPVYEIWRSNKEQQHAGEIKPIDGKQHLLVYRDEYKSSIAVINNNEYSILKAIINNLSLQEIINNTNFDINNVLPVLITNRWIVGIK
ncbi:MAG: putative DNA-binding domain-containing protein [Proteobacteria bacterium]|nr:putative DNA-binding domain-containing protein [Pseudomonadota bacterium]